MRIKPDSELLRVSLKVTRVAQAAWAAAYPTVRGALEPINSDETSAALMAVDKAFENLVSEIQRAIKRADSV